MANHQHLEILKQGVDAWNRWRKMEGAALDLSGALLEHADLAGAAPDLSGADLSGALLEHADLSGADLAGANLQSAQLRGARLTEAKLEGCKLPGVMGECRLLGVDLSGRDLSGRLLDGAHLDEANLSGAKLRDANLEGATLCGTDLRGADLEGGSLICADLSGAKLSGANLRACDLSMAVLSGTDLEGTQLAEAEFDRTILANLELSGAQGLGAAVHEAPSTIGTDTLERTLAAAAAAGKARALREVEKFFRAAGVEEHLIDHYRSRPVARPPYEPAYIIHSRKDSGLAQMLHEELQARGVRCWIESKTRFADASAFLTRRNWKTQKVILCASTKALETEWAQAVIAHATSPQRARGHESLIVVDLDGCLRGGWKGEHAEWISARVAADLSGLESAETRLEEAIEKVADRLRAR